MIYIHPKAEIGDKVELGDNVSIWAFAVIRTDEGAVKIGNNKNIQEHVVIHGANVEIGENVTVGHSAVIHGARIGNNVLIGINSIILDNAEIGDWVVVAAGAVIPPGVKIPSNSLVMGVPGKVKRSLTEDDRRLITSSYQEYLRRLPKTPDERSSK
ncbi:MAG: gamma carbonic anhydrase family protein [Candidatus Bathyarchaeia archaeon]